ncbi:hypothetical protein FNV43_RR06327 [Rhamnella rubrinervis]|uniref:Uncharacterized protein n=1 Tax=Rhamnella rubrinervis TaxID=2594499 RepID=A0A8K0MLD2_9ROSA|nr:hypothetical protein FNV43_RR06327 [Rhamnella rubrinervis]
MANEYAGGMSLMGKRPLRNLGWRSPNPISAAHGKDSRAEHYEEWALKAQIEELLSRGTQTIRRVGQSGLTRKENSQRLPERDVEVECGKSFIHSWRWHARRNGEKGRAYAATHITSSGPAKSQLSLSPRTTLLGIYPTLWWSRMWQLHPADIGRQSFGRYIVFLKHRKMGINPS